jgi:DNA-binding transcriptional MerR regulator
MTESKLSEVFSETTTAVAQAADVLPQTVRLYADLGLLEYVRLRNGTRLLKPSAAAAVRTIYKQRKRGQGCRAAAR